MPTVIHGDCIEVMPQLGQFQLVFCDPPFNIGRNYDNYYDNRSDFRDWCMSWIALAWERCDGVLCLHGPDDLAEIYLDAARHLGFAEDRLAWVNWWYDFGQCSRSNWIDARCHCLIFAREAYKWNPESVVVSSDSRVSETVNGGWRLPGTVWGVGADADSSRPLHDNQLPEVYLERLIRAYTDVGDFVLDPFGGSGTTATVAHALSRIPTTIELSETYCKSIEQRIRKGMVR